jgi:hypothetical protein
VQDCYGTFGGTAFIDSCNTCVGGNTGLLPCVQDCYGTFGGTAYIDTCGICVGGNTGVFDCDTVNSIPVFTQWGNVKIYPNPVNGNEVLIDFENSIDRTIRLILMDATGKIILREEKYITTNSCILSVIQISNGVYFLNMIIENQPIVVKRIVVLKNE